MKYSISKVQKLVSGIMVAHFMLLVYLIYLKQSLSLAIAAGVISVMILLAQLVSSGKRASVSVWLSTFTLLSISLLIWSLSQGSELYLMYHMILPVVLSVYFRKFVILLFGGVSSVFFIMVYFMNDQLKLYPPETTLLHVYIIAFASMASSLVILMITRGLKRHVNFGVEKRVENVTQTEFLDESEVAYIYYLKAISDNIIGTADEIRGIASKNIENIQREKLRLGNILETSQVMKQTFLQTKESILETKDVVEKTLAAAIRGDEDISNIMTLVNKMIKYVDITKKSIYDLTAATKKVEGVITVIDKIANQTRLLSLNASIEGARFEERQAGFVMVSKEVKQLSALTHLSVQEVTNTMRDIHIKTRTVQEVVTKEGQEAMEGLDVAKLGEQSVRYVVRMMQSIQSEVEEIIEDLERNEDMANEITEHLGTIQGFISENLERMEYLEATSLDMKIQGENLDKIIHANKVIDEYTRINDKMYALLARFVMDFEKLIEHEIRRGTIDEARLFNRSYEYIKKDDSERYTSQYDEFFISILQEVIDKYREMQPELKYFILMDNEGYIPLVNMVLKEGETPEIFQKYAIVKNPGVILQDYASKFALRSDNLYTLQCVKSEEEQVMDMSVHIHFKDKRWGLVRAGFRYS